MIEDASLTRRIALSISLRSLSDDLDAGLTMAFFEWLTLLRQKKRNNSIEVMIKHSKYSKPLY